LSLAEKYPSEIENILAKFPADQKRAGVLALLYLAQREDGYVNRDAIREIARIIDVDPTEVGGLIGFYTLLYDEPEGQVRLQICTDLPCALRGAEVYAEELCENLGVKFGETSADGSITMEEVMCIAGCDKAPVIQIQTPEGIQYHENQTVESTMSLLEGLRERDANG
jgi:NADH-quinone oxidoreductase subunit E